ncbi:MAG: hypothetical protein IPQ07_20670 [Myxococcales bacterium]|nr:hypothetical protein [Myxococcales bacterium]
MVTGWSSSAPDTSGPFGTVNFLHYSGYWSGDDKIRGFSHLPPRARAPPTMALSVMPIGRSIR